MENKHRFSYSWTLKDAIFIKDKGKVFSCFSCGGGSTMGYKLAGFDVIGCNEIDPRMMDSYIENLSPKFSFLEPIQNFKNEEELPEELYNLDILDGSPPCSSFSISGNREKNWGKEKKFREGQVKQVLDTLFFDFIDLTKRLQPKIVIAENVKGILMGKAKEYTKKILKEFDNAGYYIQYFLLDASKMGVPQKRERVFFVGLRKDLAKPFLYQKDLYTQIPYLKLNFNEPKIPYSEIEDQTDFSTIEHTMTSALWDKVEPGKAFSSVHLKGHYFNEIKLDKNQVVSTIIARDHGPWHYSIKRKLNELELKRASTFPLDYNFGKNKAVYIVGMSVPPGMVANIATEIYDQWLSKI
jgi:DNA (cytosine-5)-methyltransferase 1